MIRTQEYNLYHNFNRPIISPNNTNFTCKNCVKDVSYNLYKLAVYEIAFTLFILDRLRLEPEKLCAWLRFASYTSWKGLHFCCRTLIHFPQLKFQWVIKFSNFKEYMTLCYHVFINMEKMLLYKKTNCTLFDNNRYITNPTETFRVKEKSNGGRPPWPYILQPFDSQ